MDKIRLFLIAIAIKVLHLNIALTDIGLCNERFENFTSVDFFKIIKIVRKTVVCLQSPAVLSLSIDILYCVCSGIIIVITFRLLLLVGTTFSGFWKLHIWWVQI